MACASVERRVRGVATNACTFQNTYGELRVNREWRVDCIHKSIAPEGQLERENKDMAKKTLKKSKKLQSTKTLQRPGI
jgi:hypothetical protein